MRKRHQCLKSRGVHFITIIFRGNCLHEDTSAREPTQEPTTHNPQPTTHNPQHQDEPPSPYPLAASPSLSMGRAVAPPNLGAATPHGSTASARWRVRDCGGWFSCLGHQNATRQKLIRERDGVSALGGRRSDVKRDNQPKVGVSGEGIIIEETRSWRNVWGGRRIIVWGWQIERQKNK
jgi:hypothetical protein